MEPPAHTPGTPERLEPRTLPVADRFLTAPAGDP